MSIATIPLKPLAHDRGIARGSDLTRGLVGAWPLWENSGGRVRDQVAGLEAEVVTAPSWMSTRVGYAPQSAGSAAQSFQTIEAPRFLHGASAFSAFVVAQALGYGSLRACLAFRNGASTSGLFVLLPFDSNGGNGVLVYHDGGFTTKATGQALADDRPHVFFYLYNPVRATGQCQVYTDGALSAAFTAAGRTLTATPTNVQILAGTNAIWSAVGQVHACGFWDRVLSSDEIAEFSRDPFSLFRPKRSTIDRISAPTSDFVPPTRFDSWRQQLSRM